MFELTISTSLDKQAYITKLYKKLAPEIKNISGVAIKENYRGRSYFSLAVDKTQKDYFISKILDEIVFIIIDDYKFNFFREKLEASQENIILKSFLMAISIFDADADRDYIIKQIDMSGNILIDSLFYFKLQELRNRWQKTVDIILFNQIIKNRSSMLEVLKYLTTMSESVIETADVVISKNQQKLKQFDKTKNYKNNFSGLSEFLTEMIELNPAKINLRVSDERESEVVQVLEKIFYDIDK